MPQIIVTRNVLKQLVQSVNQQLKFTCVDEGFSSLRVDGFDKFDRITKTFKENTRYIPIDSDIELNEDFYSKIWLPADEKTPTQLRDGRLFNSVAQSNSIPNNRTEGVIYFPFLKYNFFLFFF